MNTVNGNGEKKNGDNPHLNHCFQGMECISRPRGWVGGLVMNQVEDLKNGWMMHKPVCPVEIGVVNDEHEGEGSKKVKPPMLRNFCVMCSIGLNGRVFNKKQRNKCKKQHRDEGVAHFA